MPETDGVASDPLVRGRSLLLTLELFAVAGWTAIAVVHHPHGRWLLVVWGVVITLVGLGLIELMNAAVFRLVEVPRGRRELLRRRRPVILATAVTCGLVFGLIATVLGTTAVDILAAVIMVVMLLVTALFDVAAVRRLRQAAE